MGTYLALTPDDALSKSLRSGLVVQNHFPCFGPPKSSYQFDEKVFVGPKGVVRGVNKGENPAPEGPNSGHPQHSGVVGWP